MIHPSSIIDPKAQIGKDVEIGPFCCVGPNVTLGNHVRLVSHVYLSGHTHIDNHTVVHPFASIGCPPQDLKFKGETSNIYIGEYCSIREHVTIHPGTEGDKLLTSIGDHCLIMVGAHIAHDCIIGSHVVMANQATLGGHVHIDDHVIIGGLSAVQQFVHIGMHTIIGGMSGVEKDVLPYAMVVGERAHLNGLNIVGLKRHHFERNTIERLQKVYNTLFSEEDTLLSRIEHIKQENKSNPVPEVDIIIQFLENSRRGLCAPYSTQHN